MGFYQVARVVDRIVSKSKDDLGPNRLIVKVIPSEMSCRNLSLGPNSWIRSSVFCQTEDYQVTHTCPLSYVMLKCTFESTIEDKNDTHWLLLIISDLQERFILISFSVKQTMTGVRFDYELRDLLF